MPIEVTGVADLLIRVGVGLAVDNLSIRNLLTIQKGGFHEI
jgi:hypothetical protein